MIDQVHVLIQSGDGGNGTSSFMNRSDKKFVPSGGEGGMGARVIVRVSEMAPSLDTYQFKQHWIAEAGANGGTNHKRGRNGKDLVLLVPEGTRLYDRERNLVLRENMRKGEELVLLEGGRGGKGNTVGKEATSGQKGARMDLEITIRILADIFIIGLPNSGKSTLLNRMTRSHIPTEIYPFSTRDPRLGVYKISDYESLTLCEIPSIGRGSSEGRGVGNHFLRHAESAKMILWMIDPVSQFAESLTDGLAILREETKLVIPALNQFQQAVLVNKIDLKEAEDKAEEELFDPGMPVFFISAQTGAGFGPLEDFLKEFYQLLGKA
ncbi:MAG: 50S ribosome-binding GTPase [Candidatus Omnitrophica bacterium]|nr:50S ribosome-binding GTPase [Candidatus Omnitrophota bacterium]